ncbi:hypothetical protein [Peribacillus frigoritolerans]|uniref:Uncharacterized protein n=1 Tax=Peribacillus frigoritolerans TaxID=450367 RepID=A0AAJ1VEM7_9BACI|nr:hypothetical protein [Peribacillus frigoritolerans]MDM5284848.1 hypothetical protein [Peribacillus frigoritolerans]
MMEGIGSLKLSAEIELVLEVDLEVLKGCIMGCKKNRACLRN